MWLLLAPLEPCRPPDSCFALGIPLDPWVAAAPTGWAAVPVVVEELMAEMALQEALVATTEVESLHTSDSTWCSLRRVPTPV